MVTIQSEKLQVLKTAPGFFDLLDDDRVVVVDAGPTKTEVVAGTLVIRLGPMNQQYMLAHEIAHVINATDRELFMPRLGLRNTTTKQADSIPTVDEVLREARVFATHYHIADLAGVLSSNLSFDGFAIRNAGIMLPFIVAPMGVTTMHAYEAEFERYRDLMHSHYRALTPDALLSEWRRKLALIAARATLPT